MTRKEIMKVIEKNKNINLSDLKKTSDFIKKLEPYKVKKTYDVGVPSPSLEQQTLNVCNMCIRISAQ